MSHTTKPGKRDKYTRLHAGGKTEAPEIRAAIAARHLQGSTEKILRRNRRTWVRLGNKRRRAIDKRAVQEAAT